MNYLLKMTRTKRWELKKVGQLLKQEAFLRQYSLTLNVFKSTTSKFRLLFVEPDIISFNLIVLVILVR